MKVRVWPLIVALLCVALVASACGGGLGTSPDIDSSRSSSGLAPSPNDPTAVPSIPEAEEVVPDPVELTADDLVSGMPTNKQMSMIQGYRFEESDNWVDDDEEGPEWTNNAPLTKEQRFQLNLGKIRRTKPEQCMLVAFVTGDGISQELSNPDAITAAAYSKRANDYRSYKRNLVLDWTTVALVLKPGQATVWADNIANLFQKCRKFTAVKKNGDIERVDLTEYYPADKSTYASGQAYVIKAELNTPKPVSYLTVLESIGNVFYETSISLCSDEKATLARVSKAYNVLADNVAEAAQVTREDVNFNDLTPFVPDPDAYVAPNIPLSSGART